MATIRVSSNSQLSSALKSAGSGDTISVSGGTYSLSLKGDNYGGAKIVAANGADVNFSHVKLVNVKNLTFDNVDFAGRGTSKLVEMQGSDGITIRNSDFSGNSGMGFWVYKSDGITLQNNTFTGFKTGAWIGSTDDLTFSNNKLSNISLDGMIIGHVHGAVISGNSISLAVSKGTKHTDGIQFYNSGVNDPLSNITIQNNRIQTHNQQSHGIYVNNEIAGSTGKASAFFKNITIDHNTIVSGQVSGIAVGETNGLKITNNILLQDPANRSSSGVMTPVIRVEHDSTGVSITGNVTHVQPAASGNNWQPTGKAEPSWTIANNKIVSRGTSVASAENQAPNAGAADSVKAAGAASAATATVASAESSTAAASAAAASTRAGDGAADTFRFYGDSASKATTHLTGVDFAEGDKLALHRFDAGTFHDVAGGNALQVSADGAFAKIDSLADLRELDRASAKVSVHTNDDVLVLDIAQAGEPDHMIKLHGLGHAYADLV